MEERLDMMNVDIAAAVLEELQRDYPNKYYTYYFDSLEDQVILALAIQHARGQVNEKYKAVDKQV